MIELLRALSQAAPLPNDGVLLRAAVLAMVGDAPGITDAR